MRGRVVSAPAGARAAAGGAGVTERKKREVSLVILFSFSTDGEVVKGEMKGVTSGMAVVRMSLLI